MWSTTDHQVVRIALEAPGRWCTHKHHRRCRSCLTGTVPSSWLQKVGQKDVPQIGWLCEKTWHDQWSPFVEDMTQNKGLADGFSPTHLKNMLVKLDHFPKCRGENNPSIRVATSQKTKWPIQKSPSDSNLWLENTPLGVLGLLSFCLFVFHGRNDTEAKTKNCSLRQGWDEVMACNKNVTKMWLMRYVQFLQTSEHIIHKPWYRKRKGAINLARGESPWAENLRNSLVLVFWQRETSPRNLQSCQLKVSRAFFFLVRRCTDNPTWVWTSCSTLRWSYWNTNRQHRQPYLGLNIMQHSTLELLKHKSAKSCRSVWKAGEYRNSET